MISKYCTTGRSSVPYGIAMRQLAVDVRLPDNLVYGAVHIIQEFDGVVCVLLAFGFGPHPANCPYVAGAFTHIANRIRNPLATWLYQESHAQSFRD